MTTRVTEDVLELDLPRIRAMANVSLSGGSVTIRKNVGFASITRTATGRFTCVLNEDAPDNDYGVLATAGNDASLSGVFLTDTLEFDVPRTVNTFGVGVLNNGSWADLSEITVMVVY